MAQAWLMELIEGLVQAVPVKDMVERKKSLSVNKISAAIEDFCERIKKNPAGKKFGFIRRALVANQIKWSLMELGYPKDFVEMVTEAAIVAMTKSKA